MAADTQITWKVTRDQTAEWSQRLKARVATETETFANNVLAEAQANVRVRTGATHDSGTVQGTGDDPVRFEVRFGGAAIYLEYGTSHHPAYPFLRPAFMSQLPAYITRLAMTTQGRVRDGGMSAGVIG